MIETNRTYFGDCRAVMRDLLAQGGGSKVRTIVTSPPYWGLRDYGHKGQLGLEKSPERYVASMVSVFRLARKLLAPDGTLWLNLGDSYAGSGRGGNPTADTSTLQGGKESQEASMIKRSRKDIGPTKRSNAVTVRGSRLPAGLHAAAAAAGAIGRVWVPPPAGLKQKDLVGIPWMVAFALRADGWYLRSDIIWDKPNPMPESVQDRPTRAHEYIFLMSKSPRYYYDAAAIRQPYSASTIKEFDEGYNGHARKDYAGTGAQNASDVKRRIVDKQRGHSRRHAGFNDRWDKMTVEEQRANGSNKRSVWHISTHPYPGAHFATFPAPLIEPCILAGSAPGDIVLDPFLGSGTTAQVAQHLGRRWIGIELNRDYEPLQRARTAQTGMAI